MSDYEIVVGLEVHIQLNTKSKMFCGCSNDAIGKEPNAVVCPVCFGMPGTLPVTNKAAILKTLLLGKVLGCTIEDLWQFERKNYFYPDLPKGYQITSSSHPPLTAGHIDIVDGIAAAKQRIHFHHIHLEEDAGKLIHGNEGYSYVDLNRAGTPLIELVTDPDFRDASTVKVFLQQMQSLVRSLGISEGDMENGHLRCDANVSVRPIGQNTLGRKVEIKNLNSFSHVEKAIEHEFIRQRTMLVAGKEVDQETRSFREKDGTTVTLRSKEDVEDYRYLPEPDLPPIVRSEVPELTDTALAAALAGLTLPDQRVQRLEDFGLGRSLAKRFSQDEDVWQLLVECLTTIDHAAERASFALFLNDPVLRLMTELRLPIADIHLGAEDLVALFRDLGSKKLTHQVVKTALPALLQGSVTLAQVLQQADDASDVDVHRAVGEVLRNHATAVQQWRAGDTKVFGFLVGQVMAATAGKANPEEVNKVLHQVLADQQ